ncbi:MAG: hypothetical protein J5608_03145 [Alphaproteobacteria bacterium]|nr:hypothetical protein [Alphaproteobacteria bacterium]
MKQQNKIYSPKMWAIAAIAVCAILCVMCHERERQEERDDLDSKIADLDKQLGETKDLHTAKVPQNLRQTQDRYIKTTDSLMIQADTLDFCIAQNDSLVSVAFNNYATRVGRDFQLSKFLSPADIAVFQQNISALDSGEYVQNMARGRILNNRGSLHDLSYFFEMFDFDSINTKLENKLAWNFYTDSTAVDVDEPTEISSLNFENPALNTALNNETNLLNRAWQPVAPAKDSVPDTITDTNVVAHDTLDESAQQPAVNFNIPEFDSVRAQYMRNDSVITKYNNTMTTMLHSEDTLEKYKQTIRRQRDSLYQRRRELDK